MNKSICIISPSINMGGIERALVLFANTFIQKGYKVDFIACLNSEHFYPLRSEVLVIEPDFKRFHGLNNKLIYYLRLCFFIRRTIMKKKPDVILSFGDWFNPIVLLALYGLKYPVFISDRTSPDYKFKFPVPILKKLLYPKSAGFIAQTNFAAEYNRKKFKNRLNIRVIPNAVRDVKIYPEISREKMILYVGRFAWEKSPERLIKSFIALADKKGWQLHMAGDGPLLNKIKELVCVLNYEEEIIFHGKVQEIDHLYARAGIYVLPSKLEGFPNSLCEAMAAGLPCICFDKIPYQEIFTNGIDGIAVRDDDLNELTNAMARLMENKPLREAIGECAKDIRKRLNVESVGEQVLNFILEK